MISFHEVNVWNSLAESVVALLSLYSFKNPHGQILN